ncbi:MAG: purine phosphoribosyltransferase family protein [Oceanicoccus sp.]
MDFFYYLDHIDMRSMAKPDFSTLFADPVVFSNLIKDLCKPFNSNEFDKVVAPESMGFILGSAIALKLKKGFIPVRKGGKLPTLKKYIIRQSFTDYTQEKNTFEMNRGLIEPGDKVLIVDDWIETGGQIKGIAKLLEKQGAEIVGVSLLGFNQTRKTKSISTKYNIKSIYEYTDESKRDLTKRLDADL